MIWLWTSVLSAALLGCYEISKKQAVRSVGAMQVLLFSTLLSTLFILPLLFLREVPSYSTAEHLILAGKSALVMLSWICGIYAIKHLPLTTVGIVKASRPVFILLGCMLIFAERPNAVQLGGILLAIVALYLLGRSSRSEGISFSGNRWVWCLFGSVLFGVCSALVDKYVMRDHDPLTVQVWCNVYITVMLALVMAVIALFRCRRTCAREAFGSIFAFRPQLSLLLISVFLTVSDYLYFYSLSCEGSLLSVVSMLRRSSVIVTFLGGALLFKEGNLRAKAFEMALLLVAMALLLFGSYL